MTWDADFTNLTRRIILDGTLRNSGSITSGCCTKLNAVPGKTLDIQAVTLPGTAGCAGKVNE